MPAAHLPPPYSHTDINTVVPISSARLTLAKMVRNVTCSAAVGTGKNSSPGQMLGFVINHYNVGNGALNTIVISDATFAYTILVSATCVALPFNICAGSVTTQPAAA